MYFYKIKMLKTYLILVDQVPVFDKDLSYVLLEFLV